MIVEAIRIIKEPREQVIYQSKDYRKKRKPKIFHIKITFYRKIGITTRIKILFAFVIFILIIVAGIWYFVFRGLPSPNQLINRKVDVSTKIYDRNGILLYQIYKDQNRTPVALPQVPDITRKATLAAEDSNFYNEYGFSWKGIIRSLLADITNQDLTEGGSTITQQLVKNTLLSPEKTWSRKIKELVLSIEVEREFSKDQILSMYLNEVSYGGSAYGIEAASEQYFGKDVSQLTTAESALLAGLPKSPTTYSPFGADPDLAINRQQEVLGLMKQDKFITADQYNEAINEKLNFANNQTNIKAPHFVMYVRQKLVDEYGEDEVERGGLNVITTLDYNIQQIAQDAVTSQVANLKGLHVTNGAAIVLDPKSGDILAMVGSTDYFNATNDGEVNVTTALRPPGSSIKIVNYAYALGHGYTPLSVIDDSPITFKFAGSPSYTPVNYDGKFVGPITLRNALAQSRNIPAVKVLASYGVQNMINLGQAMGITTWNEKNTYGLSLTLGGGSTRLIDMARVYATVADSGNRPAINSLLKVTDYKGNNLPFDCDTGNCESENVIDPRVSYQLINILSDNNARAPEFGEHSSLVINGHPEVAVKTGTSNDLRDNLTIGFNQNYLTAVWVGNNDNSPMARIASGITGAAPIWNEIEGKLIGSDKPINWNVPDGLIAAPCSKNDLFLNGTDVNKICAGLNKIATPSATLNN
ncbi:MAG TPA: transglycosylase domain-containing protein [Patescibacteria group bacterium]|nr:transglycosylase domain-containing protein [Patescibacteria group bacterium]